MATLDAAADAADEDEAGALAGAAAADAGAGDADAGADGADAAADDAGAGGVDAAAVEPIRHARRPRSRPWILALKTVASVAVCALVGVGAVVGYVVADTVGAVRSGAVDLGLDADRPVVAGLGSIEGGFDLLLVGTDNDADQGDAFGERDATLNDVNIWLHVSADHSSAVALSFPRDLVIPHPECTDPATGETFWAMSAQPLNVAFGRGGLACVAQTVSALTGTTMDYAATISFNGVIALSDAVGGVEVCVDEAISDPGAALELPAGTSTIQGATALAFLRTRYGVGDGSDISRISNQQSFLSSLVRRVKSDSTLSDAGKVLGLARVAAEQMRLSTELADPFTMASLALTLKDVPLDRIVFVQYPSGSSVSYPGKVVPRPAEADELVASILADQPFELGEGSLGEGVEAAPGGPGDPSEPSEPSEPSDPSDPDAPAVADPPADPADPPAEDPVDPADPADPVDPADPGASGEPAAPAESAPPVLDGVLGQSAAVTTCAKSYEF